MASENLNSHAYNTLLKRIVSTEYKPGEVLNESSLVDDMGMSRTTIHSAMIRLQQEHLIDFLPKKGFRVTSITPDTIREIHDIRDMIEPYAIRYARRPMSKDRLLYYMNIFKQSDGEEYRKLLYTADSDFHLDVVLQSDNSLLCDYYRSMQPQFERISNLCGEADTGRLEFSNKEHLDIILALLQDDTEGAEQALRRHLRQSREAAYRYIVIEKPSE